MAPTVLLVVLVLALVLTAIYQFWIDLGEKAQVARAIAPEASEQQALRRRTALDRLVIKSRWGSRVQGAITLTGWSISPSRFVLAGTALCTVVGLLLGMTLSWILFPFGFYGGYLLIRGYLRREREKRKEEFISQMPELARTLSNASSAGLSIRTAVAMAADELAEPARSELRTVSDEINLGVSLDTALSDMEDRLPSRELGILVSALVVSSRSGGALVSALRDISETLETRKEVRREIRTTYAQTVATAYAVLAVGTMSLFLLEAIHGGTVDAMLRNPVGQASLVFAALVYSGSIWAVRRMTRVEV
jgi:tight adherence protein B